MVKFFSRTQNSALQLGGWLLALGAEEHVKQEAGSQSPRYMGQTPSGTFSCTPPKRTGKWKYLPNPLPLPGALGKGLGSTECDRSTLCTWPAVAASPCCAGLLQADREERTPPALLSGLGPGPGEVSACVTYGHLYRMLWSLMSLPSAEYSWIY